MLHILYSPVVKCLPSPIR